MNIIKLSAIPSTNDYLKQLSKQYSLPDFTVVVAKNQTQGKGQMGEVWLSEEGKSLLFSVLVRIDAADVSSLFLLNALTALSITRVLSSYNLDGLCIKWPNDILSYNKKIGGILIENMFKSSGQIDVVIGIGINFAQTNFAHLPSGSSIYHTYQQKLDQEEVMTKIVTYLQKNLPDVRQRADYWWDAYHEKLFRKDEPNLFEKDGQTFTGIIRGVTRDGFLQLADESNQLQAYALKEIKMIY